MSIIMLRHYRVECDFCGDSVEITGWSSKEDALKDLIQSGRFVIYKNKHCCSTCYQDNYASGGLNE